MKLNYFADTDTLYIDLVDRASVESDEVGPDVVLDRDADGNVVGIEVEHASTRVDLANVSFANLPFQFENAGRDKGIVRQQESSMTALWSTPEDDVWNDVPSR